MEPDPLFCPPDYTDSPKPEAIRHKAIWACWIILLILFCVGMILTIPAQAIEINPSVETLPLFCQYSITQPLCDFQKPAAQGPPGPQGPPGIMNQTPNMTLSLPTTYYLHNATLTENGTLYHTMRRYFPTGAEDSNTTTLTDTNTDYLLAQFITEAGDPNLGSLIPGDRKWFTYVSTSSITGGNTHLQFRLYAYHVNGTKNLIYSFQGQNLYDTGVTRMVDSYTLEDAYPMNTTDRFIMEYYANTSIAANPTVTMYWDDNVHVSKIESPITLTGIQGPPGPAGTAINESYAYLPGRDGGQTLNGATNGGTLTLNGSANGGNVLINPLSGSIGVGTSSPSDFFHVYTTVTKGFRLGAVGEGLNKFGYITNGIRSDTVNYQGYMVAGGFGGTNENRVVIGGGTTLYKAATNINFYTGDNVSTTSGTERMRISNAGNVGIGTSTPTNMLDVTGSIRLRNCSGTPTFSATGNLTCASDEKLKTNIKTYTNGLNIIRTLPAAIQYNWSKSTGFETGRVYTGYSANQLYQVYPEAIIRNDDTQTLNIDDRALIALLTNALKEEDLKVQAHQAQIDELKARLDKAGIK